MVLHLEALVAIALSLSILMAIAWTVQQRAGKSGWVDTIWTFRVGLVEASSAPWPIEGAAPNWRSGRCGSARTSRRGASAIAPINRIPACFFRCRRKREWVT
jgi:hypothetical protein